MAGLRALSIGVVATVLALTGCRSAQEQEPEITIRTITEDLIKTDVAELAGIGELTPVCPDLPTPTVGTMWECTATSEDQRIVALTASIDDAGKVQLVTTNMITAAALPSFERAAVAALNSQVGSKLTDDAVDCGELSVVFGQDKVMVCALLDPLTERIFDVSLTITDIEARQFSLVVADAPRP